MSLSLDTVELFANILEIKNQLQAKSTELVNGLQGRSVNVAQTEEHYTQITKLFGTLQSSIATYTRTVGDDMAEIILATSVKDEAEVTMNKLSHTVLTYFPYIVTPGNPSCVYSKQEGQVPGLAPAAAAFIKNCDAVRPIRGDGNCFFTGFTVSFLENLASDASISSFHQFVDAHPPKDPILQELLKSISAEFVKLPLSEQEALLKKNEKIFPFVNYFRQLAAEHIIAHQEEFAPFLDGTACDDYVARSVLPMGQNADHPAILALCTALKFPIKIFDSQIGSAKGVDIGGDKPKAILCRKDEHYFLLYPNKGDTRLIVNYTVSPGHTLFIRGEEAGLSWLKGIALQPGSTPNTWVFIFPGDKPAKYKLLLDDKVWANGENHIIAKGKHDVITPQFPPLSESIIKVRHHVPAGRAPFVRGEGAGLTWGAGRRMTYAGNDVWELRLDGVMGSVPYKILLDDKDWEKDDNHFLSNGKTSEHQPRF